MRKAIVRIHNENTGTLIETDNSTYEFHYLADYKGPPISLTMPVKKDPYAFDSFPPFFDGLLPEGVQLSALLKKYKIDQSDLFGQLIITGSDLVGAVTVEEIRADE